MNRKAGRAPLSRYVHRGWAVSQLWLFWVAPIVGALIGAVIYKYIAGSQDLAKIADENRSG